jgi:hypothetical protein
LKRDTQYGAITKADVTDMYPTPILGISKEFPSAETKESFLNVA